MMNRTIVIASMAALLGVVPVSGDQTAPDNSGINERDRNAAELTAQNQGSKKSDTELTRLLRRDITKNDELSTNAHNVKIITQNGVMTLKGPVGNQAEISKIMQMARRVAGQQKVKNEMQITGS